MPRKIRELLMEYQRAGAEVFGAKGSHRKIRHVNYRGLVIISGNPGDDAKPYQERDLKNFLKEINR